MQCTLLIPDLFWPRGEADGIVRGLELPALQQLLARARVERLPSVTPVAWLCQAFEVERQHDWPVAPLTLAFDGGVAGEGYWLRADPVHIKIAQDRLRLIDATMFDVTPGDAQALVATLNSHFSQAGMTFHAPHVRRWYIHLPRTPELVTHGIDEAAGQDVQRHLPSGGEALAWHRMFNEAQMVLHEHPVNARREARGEPAINSVWFWGGGTRAPVRGRHFDRVWSDDVLAGALGVATGIEADALPPDGNRLIIAAKAAKHEASSHLVVLDALARAIAYEDAHAWRIGMEELETRWFSPLRAALRKGALTQLTVVALLESACLRFVLGHRDLLKIWRRPKAFAAYA